MRSVLKLNFFLFIILCACAKSTPTLQDVDLKIFIEDKKGCLGKRSFMKKSIADQKEKLLGLSEIQVVDLLGSPDHNELYKRNQKFYYYSIDPSAECIHTKSDDHDELIIRFNAIGLSSDVSIE